MELYQLRTFVAVAEEGNLTRAAERLFVSQPAVSAQIKALEEELGVVLFARTPKGMQLTREGEALVRGAREALASVGALAQQAQGLREELSGNIAIALNTDADFLRIRPFLEQLRQRHPGLTAHLPQSMSNLIIDDIRAGRVDGGFAYGESMPQDLAGLRLRELDLMVVAPRDWQDRLACCGWAELAREPWVWYSDALPCHRAFKRKLSPHTRELKTVAITDYEGTIQTLVASGAGLGIMRRDAAEACAQAGQVCIWPGECLRFDLYFLHRRERENDPALRAVLAVLRRIWEIGEAAAEKTEGASPA